MSSEVGMSMNSAASIKPASTQPNFDDIMKGFKSNGVMSESTLKPYVTESTNILQKQSSEFMKKVENAELYNS